MDFDAEKVHKYLAKHKLDIPVDVIAFLANKTTLAANVAYYLQMEDKDFATLIASVNDLKDDLAAAKDLITKTSLIDRKEYRYIWEKEFWEYIAEYIVNNLLPEDENSAEFKEIMNNLEALQQDNSILSL